MKKKNYQQPNVELIKIVNNLLGDSNVGNEGSSGSGASLDLKFVEEDATTKEE